jgi:hypothetical protein
MYICLKCKKSFTSPSKLERHKNIKKPCDSVKEQLKCDVCNVKFARLSEQIRHEKTKKHIDNNTILVDDIKPIDIINYETEFKNLQIKFNNIQTELNILQDKYNKVLIENDLLKLNINKNLDHHEQIYIVHERTFVELNANIYKIGKTKNIKNRLNGYSKGSKLLFSIACKDCTESENKILNFLKHNEKYIHAKEYGNEYFQCNLSDLISDIYNLIIC